MPRKHRSTERDSLLNTDGQLSQEQDEYGSIHVDIVDPRSNDHRNETAVGRSERLVSSSQGSSVLSCHSINYSVNVKMSPCGKKTVKQILKDVNGLFKPGMNAILGPTGSGKSSLLDVLAGRKDPRGLQGSILLDGMPPPENFKCMFGYVVQDDVVMGTLTVRENFAFSARLRLPSSVTEEERKQRIDQVIYELGLTEVADSKVGNEFIRGISGGERKRCNIGMELIISPPVLFLDEPTTGLDASTANAVMLLLKRLSQRGRNIIFSIHQPRYSIYRLFDSLMLLSHGDVVYHGPSAEALNYFTTIGYQCEEHNNPPDFFLDIINGDSTAVSSIDQDHDGGMQPNGGHIDGQIMPKSEREHIIGVDAPASLRDQFYKSEWFKRVQEQVEPIYEQFTKHGIQGQLKKINYKSTFGTQLLVVSGRAIRNLYRNPQTSFMQFFVVALFALIVGGVYFDTSSSFESGIQNRAGAFFFIIMNQVFGNMSAVELFIQERSVFIHENVSGFYRVSAYFISKVFCDVIPMRLIPSIIFSSIAYFMIDLRDGFDHFCIFTLTLFMTALSASALSFAISSTVRIFAIANLCLALSYVFMMLFSGLLINIGDLGDWISWIKYFSIFRYSLNLLQINELKDMQYCSNVNGTIMCAPGNAYLEVQAIDYKTSWDLWQNMLGLSVITIVFMILSYVQLRRIQKLK